MVEHGHRKITEINWLFNSVDRSLGQAQSNFDNGKRSRAYISLRHAKNLAGFLQRSLGEIPDQKIKKHLHEFFTYINQALETSIRGEIADELAEMRVLLSELHEGWLHLVSPMRGIRLHDVDENRAASKH